MFVKNALLAVLAVAPAILAAPLPSATTGVAATTTTAATTTPTPAAPLGQKAHHHHQEVVEDKALRAKEHHNHEEEALLKAEEVVVKDRLKMEEEAASSTAATTAHPTATPAVPAPKAKTVVKRSVASDKALLAELEAKEKTVEKKEAKVEGHEHAVAAELALEEHHHDPSHTHTSSSVAPTATLHRRADPTTTPASSTATGAVGAEATGTHQTHHEFKLVMQRIVEMAKVLDKMAKDLTHDHTGKKALKDIDAMEARYVKAHAKHAAKHAEAAAAATTTSPAAAAAATQTTA